MTFDNYLQQEDEESRERRADQVLADLATVTRQRDALLAACKHALPIILSVTVLETHYMKSFAEVAERDLRSAIAACGEGEG